MRIVRYWRNIIRVAALLSSTTKEQQAQLKAFFLANKHADNNTLEQHKANCEVLHSQILSVLTPDQQEKFRNTDFPKFYS